MNHPRILSYLSTDLGTFPEQQKMGSNGGAITQALYSAPCPQPSPITPPTPQSSPALYTALGLYPPSPNDEKVEEMLSTCVEVTKTDKGTTFQCRLCQQTCTKRNTLKSHLLKHLRTMEDFACAHCNKGFRYNWQLQRHIKAVHLAKTRKCPHCSKELRCGSYHHHVRLHHTQQREFPCNLCDKSFIWKSALQTHIEDIHGEKKECVVCHKGIPLRKHETHTLRCSAKQHAALAMAQLGEQDIDGGGGGEEEEEEGEDGETGGINSPGMELELGEELVGQAINLEEWDSMNDTSINSTPEQGPEEPAPPTGSARRKRGRGTRKWGIVLKDKQPAVEEAASRREGNEAVVVEEHEGAEEEEEEEEWQTKHVEWPQQ